MQFARQMTPPVKFDTRSAGRATGLRAKKVALAERGFTFHRKHDRLTQYIPQDGQSNQAGANDFVPPAMS